MNKRTQERPKHLSLQHQRDLTELSKFEYMNNTERTWSDTYDNVINLENNKEDCKPIECRKFFEIAAMIESIIPVDITELAIPNKDGYINQILKNMPFFYIEETICTNIC